MIKFRSRTAVGRTEGRLVACTDQTIVENNDESRDAPEEKLLRSIGLPLLVIPIGGAIMIALTLVAFLGLYLGIEALFFADNPQGFPADPLRKWSTVALIGLYLLFLRSKAPDLLKAIVLMGPLVAAIITTGHALYRWPVISITAMLAVAVVCGLLLYRFKKPWIYYYAGAIATVVGLVYAWPRPHLNEPGYGLLLLILA